VDARSEPAEAVAAAPAVAIPLEPRQRWRLVVARALGAPRLTQRETSDAWEAAVDASGLPVVRGSGGSSSAGSRPRLAFGAPLPVELAATGELIDLFLADRLPRWRVREGLEARAPEGWSVVDLEDVWLGGPALAGIVAAADYRIELATPVDVATPVDGASLADACRRLLAATTLRREREKGGGTISYDLRPLLVDVAVVDPGPPVVIRARTRFHATLGTGRPDEVVAALSEQLGIPLAVTAIVRERLVLVADLD
jgi:radical SAM-linked protein